MADGVVSYGDASRSTDNDAIADFYRMKEKRQSLAP